MASARVVRLVCGTGLAPGSAPISDCSHTKKSLDPVSFRAQDTLAEADGHRTRRGGSGAARREDGTGLGKTAAANAGTTTFGGGVRASHPLAEADGHRTRRGGSGAARREDGIGLGKGAAANAGTTTFGGGGRESNPPGTFRPPTGFEDRGAHQALGRLREGG